MPTSTPSAPTAAAAPNLLRFHVGLAPFLTAEGKKMACYQLVNSRSAAVATCTIVDGQMEQVLSAPKISVEAFHQEALKHFRNTAPIVFTSQESNDRKS